MEQTRFDVVIRGGKLVDGTGSAAKQADVGIRDGKVVQIGDLSQASAAQEIDATGRVVAPGVIDPHTHYDAQIYWDPYCTNSGWHGVTSVVVGNCGFGFSPCRSDDRLMYMKMMENTEQVPMDAMKTALPWDWESFPEWIASVKKLKKGINLAAFLPLNSLMIWVMGYEAAKSRKATDEERAEMRRLLNEAMDAGAIGFGFSYLQEFNSHKDVDGSPMITDIMHEEEAINLALVLKERGEGVIQTLVETGPDTAVNRELCEKLAEISGRPVLHTVITLDEQYPDRHREILSWLDEMDAKGLRIFSQALVFRFMPMAFVVNQFDGWQQFPLFNEFQHPGDGDTIDARIAKALDEDYRERLAAAMSDDLPSFLNVPRMSLVDAAGSERFEKYVGKSFTEIGKAEGIRPTDAFLDLCAETRLNCEVVPRREEPNVEYATEVNSHPKVLPGTSDGGAHPKFWAGGQYGTDLISWLVRERKTMTLEQMHHKLSAVPASALDWQDRGTIEVGKAADIMVYDLDNIGMATSTYETVNDMPGNEWRRIVRPKGIDWILVNGVVTFEDNVCTDATPGKLITLEHDEEVVPAEPAE